MDNYTTLVRPQLDQRIQNQQFNRDINGLDRNTNGSADMLQQPNHSRRPQGMSTPQFYMNTGNVPDKLSAGYGLRTVVMGRSRDHTR